MDRIIDLIYQTLEKMVGSHRQMLDAVRAENRALADANTQAIQEVVYQKEALIESVRQQESERIRLMTQLGATLKKPIKDFTLNELIVHVQGFDIKKAEKLRTSFNTLKLLIQRITDQNGYNRALVERSLKHVQNMKNNVLSEAAPNTETYSQSGAKSVGGQKSRFLSQEA